MTDNDRMAELSYAYLHAVAAGAGFGCSVGSRMDDVASVDALIRVNQRLTSDSLLFNFPFGVQLKATHQPCSEIDGKYSYFLDGIDRYNKLRGPGSPLAKLLVVLFLPSDVSQWLTIDEDALIDSVHHAKPNPVD